MQEEIVIKVKPPDPNTCNCPVCHGQGHRMDGSISYGATEIRIRPATPCGFCKGKGRVRVKYEPLE